MERSAEIEKLAGALAKAQLAFNKVARDKTARVRTKTGGEYSYDFADLESVLDGVRQGLSENELSVTFDCETRFEPTLRVVVIATLWHASGQWLQSSPLTIPCSLDMATPQAIGSACTYGRRYQIQALLGISTDRDEDGTLAGGNVAEVSPRGKGQKTGGSPPKTVTQQKWPTPPAAAPSQDESPGVSPHLVAFAKLFPWPAEVRWKNVELLVKAAGSTMRECAENDRIALNVANALTSRLSQLTQSHGGDFSAAATAILDDARRVAAEQGFETGPSKATAGVAPAPSRPEQPPAKPPAGSKSPPWQAWRSAPLIGWLEQRVPQDRDKKTRAVKALLRPWDLGPADFQSMSAEQANTILGSLTETVNRLVSEGVDEQQAIETMVRAGEQVQ